MRRLDIREVRFPLKKPFAISYSTVSEVELVEVVIEEDGVRGRGECRPYPRYGESVTSVTGQIETMRARIEAGIDRKGLLAAMPAGAARNAIDNALHDLAAKQAGRPLHELLGLAAPEPVAVTYTIGLDTPEAMAREALESGRPLLKLKLGGAGDLERVEAVRKAVPETRLIVDANEAWTADNVREWLAPMAAMRIELIEQPLPAGKDEALRGIERKVPLCADESFHEADDLPAIDGLYDFVNIKLDKTGGLTAALEAVDAAETHGYGIMLGCMMASSLSMAQAFPLAARARFVDLDAPLLLAADRDPPVRYDGAIMQPPPATLWG